MKLVNLRVAAWLQEIITEKHNVMISDEDENTVIWASQGIIGEDTETAVVVLTNSTGRIEMPFMKCVELRMKGLIWGTA